MKFFKVVKSLRKDNIYAIALYELEYMYSFSHEIF